MTTIQGRADSSRPNLLIGIVIRVNYSYPRSLSDAENIYTIQVALADTEDTNSSIITAKPYSINNLILPLPGESVILIKGLSSTVDPSYNGKTYYYLGPYGIYSHTNDNGIPPLPVKKGPNNSSGNSLSYLNQNSSNSVISENYQDVDRSVFTERGDIRPLQAFPGDYVIQGRYGNSIKFGSTPKGKGQAYEEPTWNSGEGNPITIIRNGQPKSLQPRYNELIIEDINKDGSSIYLTTNQKISLTPAQRIPQDSQGVNSFTGTQVIGNADRIILNSRKDDIILSSAKNISIATPKWSATLDKVFDVLEGIVTQLADLSSGKATFATGVGPTGPATNVSQLQQLLVDIKQLKQVSAAPAINGEVYPPGTEFPRELLAPDQDPDPGPESVRSTYLRDGSTNPSTDEQDAVKWNPEQEVPSSANLSGLQTAGPYEMFERGASRGFTDVVLIQGKPIPQNIAGVVLDILNDAKSAGVNMMITSGFRSNEDIILEGRKISTGQLTLRRQNAPASRKNDDNFIRTASSSNFKPATATPGYSKHQNGTAVDFNTKGPGQYRWMVNNMFRYGFRRTVKSERWHWEFVRPGTLNENERFGRVPRNHATWDGLIES